MKLRKFLLIVVVCLLPCSISFGENNDAVESRVEQFTLSAAVVEMNLFSLYENDHKKRLSEIGVLDLMAAIFLRPEIAQVSGKASVVVTSISDGNQANRLPGSVSLNEREQVRFTKDLYEDDKLLRVTEFYWVDSRVNFIGRISHIFSNDEGRICFNLDFRQVLNRMGAFTEPLADGEMPNTERNWTCDILIKPDGKPVIAGSCEQNGTAAFLLVWANEKKDE